MRQRGRDDTVPRGIRIQEETVRNDGIERKRPCLTSIWSARTSKLENQSWTPVFLSFFLSDMSTIDTFLFRQFYLIYKGGGRNSSQNGAPPNFKDFEFTRISCSSTSFGPLWPERWDKEQPGRPPTRINLNWNGGKSSTLHGHSISRATTIMAKKEKRKNDQNGRKLGSIVTLRFIRETIDWIFLLPAAHGEKGKKKKRKKN